MNISVQLAANPKPPASDESRLGFGRLFAPHMFRMEHDADTGWHSPRILPYGPLLLDPAAAVFHYGLAMFEGLKAFRGTDGVVRLFRADAHAHRMVQGAARICAQAPSAEEFEAAVAALVDVDRAYVPQTRGTALYIRPTLAASEGFLGVRPAHKHVFFIITSPVGAYYAEGINPVKIWVEDRYVRAARGGLGAVKVGANYAASLLAAEEAKKRGYSQVLWLDGNRHQELEEVGTMNLFVVLKDEVVTPPLAGSILPGITRDSVLTLLKDWGLPASERTLTIQELLDAHATGTLLEVFGTGTAAVISPVGELGFHHQRLVINNNQVGPLAHRLYDALTAIQYGEAEDTHGWVRTVDPRHAGTRNGARGLAAPPSTQQNV